MNKDSIKRRAVFKKYIHLRVHRFSFPEVFFKKVVLKRKAPVPESVVFEEIVGLNISSSNNKKILIFSQKKDFLIFPEMESCTFKPKLEKQKNFH